MKAALRALAIHPTAKECAQIDDEYIPYQEMTKDDEEQTKSVIDFNEFKTIISSYYSTGVSNRIWNAFKKIDTNGMKNFKFSSILYYNFLFYFYF